MSVPAANREARRKAGRDSRKQAILDAAGRVFATQGLDDASIRDIAAEAGYTPGAIYFYFDGKEAIYGEILARSLATLATSVKAAVADTAGTARAVRAGPRAFFDFYVERPGELDLSFYLARGIRPRGLTPEINRQLNGRLIALLQVMSDAVRAHAGCDEATANREAVAAVTHICGILLMRNSGRLQTLGFDSDAMVEEYLDQLAARLLAARR